MLKDKELKVQQKVVHEIEADKLGRDMTKNKLISLCVQNETKHKYIPPLSSQAEVKKCYDRIKKLSEQDQLAILRREVKLKKALFSESQVSLYISSSTISLPNKFKKICGPKGNQSANKQAKRSRAPAEEPLRDFSWP